MKRDVRDLGQGQLRSLSRSFHNRLGKPQLKVKFRPGSMGADLLQKRKRIEKTAFSKREVLFEIETVTIEIPKKLKKAV